MPKREATFSVPEILRSLKGTDTGQHSIDDYARAMERFERKAVSILHVGGDSISINLEDGDVLKITTRTPPSMSRYFDMPIKESGSIKVKHVSVNYFVQPKGDYRISDYQYSEFVRQLSKDGYWFSDPGKRNTCWYAAESRVVLIDPWAVEKVPPVAEPK